MDTGGNLVLGEEKILNTYDTDTDFAFSCDDTRVWNLNEFLNQVQIQIIAIRENGMELEFDLVGTQAPIVNALRRVLLAEVPSMAIEKVFLYQNTSLIQDEVLSHRLGLIPICVDPRLFEMPSVTIENNIEIEPEFNEKENLLLELQIDCVVNSSVAKDLTDPKVRFINSHVYTKDFKWIPIGDQQSWIGQPPYIVSPDILVAVLRPGQQIEVRCLCVKGIGRDHAKFSPVATASYRFLPQITLKRPILGEDAKKLQKSFSPGVIEIIKNENGEKEAVVADVRRDTCSRNVFRHEDLADAVILTRKKNHVIFSIESTGALKSSDLFIEACKVMEDKCTTLLEALNL